MQPNLFNASFYLIQFGWRTQAEQDHALRGQDRQIQIFSEGHRDGVYQKEDGRSVQYPPSTHCGAAGTPRNAGCQHSASTH